jgi:hypothetical protein
MSILETLVLNWSQYQIHGGIALDHNSNFVVWMTLHCHLESLESVYRILVPSGFRPLTGYLQDPDPMEQQAITKNLLPWRCGSRSPAKEGMEVRGLAGVGIPKGTALSLTDGAWEVGVLVGGADA